MYYNGILSQYQKECSHVLAYSGVEVTDLVQDGKGGAAKIHPNQTTRSNQMVSKRSNHLSKIVDHERPKKKLELDPNMYDQLQYAVVGKIFSAGSLGSVYEGEHSGQKDAYKLDAYVNDAYKLLMTPTIASRSLSHEEMNLQTAL